jgi:hypothetical protein
MSESEFTVKDKRRFTQDGEARPEEEVEETVQVEGVDQDSADRAEEAMKEAAAAEEAAAEAGTGAPPLPEVTFSTFVFSLSTSALIHLGEIADPQTNEVHRNLPLAKQTIDILGMLKDKTAGNLTSDEENLLSNMLYELRMKYVAQAK